MTWLRTTEEATAARLDEAEREARARAFNEEVEEASRGGVAELEATLVRLDIEAAALRVEYGRARAQADTRPREYGDEFRRLHQRSQDLPQIRAAVTRRIAAVKAEHGAQVAGAWNKSAGPKLMDTYLRARAEDLAPLAALVSAYEAEVAKGAPAQALLPLPAGHLAALRDFTAHVSALRARGLKVDMGGWPAAIRDRIA